MYSRVVNDQAERGVALIEEFSGHLTKDEEQLQFLLQVVQEHRRAYCYDLGEIWVNFMLLDS